MFDRICLHLKCWSSEESVSLRRKGVSSVQRNPNRSVVMQESSKQWKSGSMPILAGSRDRGARRTHMTTYEETQKLYEEGEKFLEAKAKEEGVIATGSGLLYKARGCLFTKFTDCQSNACFRLKFESTLKWTCTVFAAQKR